MEYPGYRKMEQRELQLFQVKVMKRIHDFCVDNDITYYMICGTFLGAIRHKGFIPWDDDMDIALLRKDYDRFIELFPKTFDKEDLFIQSYLSDKHYYPGHARISIGGTLKAQPSLSHFSDYNQQMYIDIFPLDKVPEAEELQLKQEKVIRKIGSQIKNKVYRIFPKNSKFTIFFKKVRGFFASVHSITYLQRKRDSIMKRYNNTSSELVCSMSSHYSYKKQTMPFWMYGTPKLYQFEDEYFFGPEHANEYLTKIYGCNYMQLPPLDSRTKPNDNYIKK